MKQLELNLNKRLLIVEFETVQEMEIEYSLYKGLPEADKKALCKGLELTEDVISQYVENFLENMDSLAVYRKYDATEKDFEQDHWSHCADDAVHSFISAVNASGYHWGEKPLENCQWKELEELNAKSRTFAPEKCIIFEIV